ncbi:hypothetical protein SK128_005418 [Halocaridina rubra]|uniref:Amine oxidase n=1 Tax=Halocaridina rubra TaxID=373956 RepID=A0AAN8WI70_HALRR
MSSDKVRMSSLFICVVFLVLGLCSVGGQQPCDHISGNFEDWIGSAVSKEVIIVGGGVAGLNAAKTLLRNGVKDVLVLEAQDYLGGRVKTYRQGSILVEDGAEWINGGALNPLYNLAEQLGGLTQPLAVEAYDWRAQTSTGLEADPIGYDAAADIFVECEDDSVLVNYHGTGYGQCYKDRFPGKYDLLRAQPEEKNAWLNYLHTWVKKETGFSNWMDQSNRDAVHFTDFGFDEWNQWQDGFDTLISYLLEGIPQSKISISSPVCKIFWDMDPEGGVLVVTANGEAYVADYIIVTTSLGHVKERHILMFSPQLPIDYQMTLNKIELGLCDKVQMGWSRPWWGNRPLDLQIIFTSFDLPEEESWLYGIMEVLSIHQQRNLLQSFVCGDDALLMEQLPEEVVKQHFLKHLKQVTGQYIPEPTFFRRSRWGKNIWMRGSYNSYVTVKGDQEGLKSRTPWPNPSLIPKERRLYSGRASIRIIGAMVP